MSLLPTRRSLSLRQVISGRRRCLACLPCPNMSTPHHSTHGRTAGTPRVYQRHPMSRPRPEVTNWERRRPPGHLLPPLTPPGTGPWAVSHQRRPTRYQVGRPRDVCAIGVYSFQLAAPAAPPMPALVPGDVTEGFMTSWRECMTSRRASCATERLVTPSDTERSGRAPAGDGRRGQLTRPAHGHGDQTVQDWLRTTGRAATTAARP